MKTQTACARLKENAHTISAVGDCGRHPQKDQKRQRDGRTTSGQGVDESGYEASDRNGDKSEWFHVSVL